MLPARANFLKLMGFRRPLAAHAGHPAGRQHAAITAGERVRLLALLREFRSFRKAPVRRCAARRRRPGQPGSTARLGRRANGRFPAFLAAASDLGLDRIGRADDAFLSHGAYGLFPAAPGRAA
jgi:hydrogenase large subunit